MDTSEDYLKSALEHFRDCVKALEAKQQSNTPDWFIAAGLVRLVQGQLAHQKELESQLASLEERVQNRR